MNSFRFGTNWIENFLKMNNIEMIIRSHECVIDGIEKFGSTNLYTIISCTNNGNV